MGGQSSFRLSDEDKVALRERAAREGRTVTDLVREAARGGSASLALPTTSTDVSAQWDTRLGVDPVSEAQPVAEGPPLWQLWTNPFVAWNPDAVLLAKQQADQGNMEFCSDLWESMLADDRVAGALEQRILASEGMPLTFVGSPRAVKRLEALWAQLMTPGLRADLFRWGMGPGICPVYVREWVDGEPRGVEVWHPRWLRYYWWERRWKMLTMSGLVDISSQPGRWYLFCPFGQALSRPWVTGLWYSTATWWLTKAYAIPDMNNYGQTRATPKWFMGVVDANATIDKGAKAQALTWLAKIPQRSSMFVPYPFKIEQHDSTSTGWEIYVREVDLANAALAQRILGSDAGMDKSANVASGGTALSVRQDLIEYDCRAETTFWRQGLLATWAEVNGVPGETPYPERVTTPPEDLAAVATVQKEAAQALSTLVAAGLAGDLDLRANLGRFFVLRDPETDEADDTVPDEGIQLAVGDLPRLGETSVVRLSAGGRVTLLKAGAKERTDFPQEGDDQKVSLRNSRYATFDPAYVDRLKEDWPEIWALGGSTGEKDSGDDQYRRLRPVIERGGSPNTPTEERAIRVREAWAARHKDNNRVAGVVALMKWFVVGSIGESRMKRVIQEEKDRREKREEMSFITERARELLKGKGGKGTGGRWVTVDGHPVLVQGPSRVKDPAKAARISKEIAEHKEAARAKEGGAGSSAAVKGEGTASATPAKVTADTGYEAYRKAQRERKRRPKSEEEHRKDLVKAHLGREYSDQEIAGLLGVQGATDYQIQMRGDGVEVRVTHPQYTMKRTFTRDEEGNVVCHNDYFEVTGEKGAGLGSTVFAQQVQSLRAHGVTHMETHAARYGEDGKEFNGYYTWPRLGYNGAIPAAARAELPASLRGSRDLRDLMSTAEGRAWWKKNGTDVDVSFDLRKGSPSSDIFDAYQAEKGR